jgi:DNA-binding FrmR family transcriptional regulator
MTAGVGGVADLVARLRKIEGQVRGLQHLAERGAELDELLTQLAAARGALHAVAVAVLAAHLETPGAATPADVLRHRLELVTR